MNQIEQMPVPTNQPFTNNSRVVGCTSRAIAGPTPMMHVARHTLCIFVVSMAMCCLNAQATLFFNDAFDYSPGNLGSVGSSAGWQNSNVGVTVTTNSLDGTGLGLPASTAHKVTTTTGSTSGTYNQFSSGIITGAVYYSFLMRVNSTAGLDAAGKVLTGLIRAGSQSSYYVDAVLRLEGGQVRLGLSKLRAVTNWFATPLSVGSTYFVVLKYEFVAGSNNDNVSLWVNPTLGSNTEPTPDITFSTGSDGNNSTGIGRCFIYGGTSVDLDEIRIASTWHEAAPLGVQPPPAVPVITGVFLTPDGLVLCGSNGPPGGSFDLLASDSISVPIEQWTEVGSENFRSDGSFCVTNPVWRGEEMKFYRLRVAGQAGPAAPEIIVQPESRTNYVGTTATFSVVATGATPLFYQWYFNGTVPLPGATASVLNLTNVQPEHAGQYTVVITNVAGAVTSQVATLTVLILEVPPSITVHPQSQAVREGATATFTVVADGPGPLCYQWYRVPETPLPGRTNSTLTLDNVTTNDAGGYFVVVTNLYGAVTSAVATLTVTPAAGLPDFRHVGFADVGFNLTGGEGGQVVTVTTGAELQAYADSNNRYVIYVSGTLYVTGMDTHVRSHKTIIGLGTNATLVGGGLYMYNSSNIIVRNLTICNSTDDNIGITSGANHIWIDHCTIYDSADGGIDIAKGADYVTVSWCRFYYTNTANTHRFVCLVGASDGDGDRDMGRLHVTFHHNWWDRLCIERMPSLRYGRAHVFNNYYNAPGNNYCVRTRLYAESRIENNWFENVQNPWEVYITTGTPGKVYATGNRFVNVTWYENPADGRIVPPGTDDVFTPPYSYMLDPVDDVPATVMEHAGAGRGPFAP